MSFDYSGRALSRIISQYRNDDKLRALLEGLSGLVNDGFESYADVRRLLYSIDDRSGVQLDLIGRVLVCPRPAVLNLNTLFFGYAGTPGAVGYDVAPYFDFSDETDIYILVGDSTYKKVLKAKAAANNTDCSIDSIIHVAEILTDDPYVQLINNQNMTFDLIFTEQPDPYTQYLLTNLNVIPEPAGVAFTGWAVTPNLDLAVLPLDPSVTLTRASEATSWDASGVLQTAAIDEPRVDHDPLTGEVLGLLIEGEATNLATNSADLSWLSATDNNRAVLLSTTDPSPIPGVNWTRFADGNDAEASLYRLRALAISVGAYHASLMIKSDATTAPFVRFPGSYATAGDRVRSACFDVATGEVVAIGDDVTSAYSVPLAGGGFRMIVEGSGASASNLFVVSFSDSPSLSGNEVLGMSEGEGHLVAGLMFCQIENAGSYIPTSGTPATRDADSASIDLSPQFNTSSGTIKVTAQVPTGETVLTLGTESIVSDSDEMKTHMMAYDVDPGADFVVLGDGLFKSFRYYPVILDGAPFGRDNFVTEAGAHLVTEDGKILTLEI